MAEFHRAGQELINAFLVDDEYLFKHYFEERQVFSAINQYYNDYEYRFEVPRDQFASVRDLLDQQGYALVPVDSIADFCVLKRKYTEHPRILFEGSVLHRSIGNFNCFVMKDETAVRQAVEHGAIELHETELDVPIQSDETPIS